MRTLLLLAALAAAAPALAQTTPARPVAADRYVYCSLPSSGTRNAHLDYGQYAQPSAISRTPGAEGDAVYVRYARPVKLPPTNAELAALDAQVQALDGAMPALTFMSSQGWECVSSNAISPNAMIYLLRRPVAPAAP